MNLPDFFRCLLNKEFKKNKFYSQFLLNKLENITRNMYILYRNAYGVLIMPSKN